MQKFLWPKISVVGAGWPKKILPAPKIPKSVAKKNSGRRPHLGTLWSGKSRKMANLGQTSHISEISMAGNMGSRGGVAEKF